LPSQAADRRLRCLRHERAQHCSVALRGCPFLCSAPIGRTVARRSQEGRFFRTRDPMPPSLIDRLPRWQLGALLLFVHLGSRVAAHVSGLRFDTSALARGWQHLDPLLLKERLFESLFYLHAQPPLFNLFLGAVLKLAGEASQAIFQFLFLGMGAALYAAIFAVMRRLGVSRMCAFVASTVFVVSPSYILYESWLFYTLPLAMLVGLATLLFARLLDRKTMTSFGAFFAVVALLCATHGLFHLVYLVACVVAVLATRIAPPRAVITAAAVPVLWVTAIYAKNAIVFGEFNESSWMGMNIALRRVDALPRAERDRLAALGVLSDVAAAEPFQALDSYPNHYADVPTRFERIRALASARKSNGEPNLNHWGYIAIARSYAHDTKFVVEHYPKILVVSLLRGWYDYFRSSSDYWFLEPNIAASSLIRMECRLFDLLLYGVLLKNSVGLFIVVALPWLVVATFRLALGSPPPFFPVDLTPERRRLLLFCAGTIAYVALVANTLNTIENMRLRFMTDPLFVILASFWVETWVIPRWQRIRGTRPAPPARPFAPNAVTKGY